MEEHAPYVHILLVAPPQDEDTGRIRGKTDKGEAVGKLISLYRTFQEDVLTIGLGDSPNDFSMLKCVDFPWLIRSSHAFPGIEKEIPNIKVTLEKGPKGWNRAVLDTLCKKTSGGTT